MPGDMTVFMKAAISGVMSEVILGVMLKEHVGCDCPGGGELAADVSVLDGGETVLAAAALRFGLGEGCFFFRLTRMSCFLVFKRLSSHTPA